MCAAPMQYDRSTTSSSGSPAATRTSTRSTAPGRRVDVHPRAGPRVAVGLARPPCRGAPRDRVRRGRASPVDTRLGERAFEQHRVLGERERAQRRDVRTVGRSGCRAASGEPRCSHERRAGRRARRRCAAIGGRLGPSRTQSSRENTTRTVRPNRSASSRAAAGAIDVDLPPNAPPLASGDAGVAAGFAPRRVGLEVRRLDPARRQAHAAGRERRQASGVTTSTVVRRPWTLPASVAGVDERLADDPATCPRPRPSAPDDPGGTRDRDQRVAWRVVVGEAAVAERHLGADAAARRRPRAGALEPAAARSRRPPARCRIRGRRDRLADRVPARAAAEVRGERAVDVDSGSDRPSRAAPPPARRSRACRTRTANRPWRRTRRRGVAYRRGRGPSTVVTDAVRRPASTGVTHATRAAPSTSTVQHPHWPWGAQPSFTDTTPSRSRRTESSDSPGAASTVTSAPLHVTRSTARTCRHSTRRLRHRTDLHRAG